MSLLLRSNETSVEVSNKTKPKSQDQQVETEVLYRQKSILALSEKVIIGDAARNEDNDEFYEDNDDDEDDDEVIDFTKPINKVVLYKAILYSKHDSNIFKLSCNCIECFKCRETVILLFIEDFEYNILWERLQLLIKKFYDLVPDETESLMHKKYSELMAKNMTKWLSDGRIDTKKNIQISLGSNLPLSNEMTFILVFSMLYTRDPHQLFELLCIQVRSIVIAYSEGLKDIIKYDDKGMAEYNPSDLLNFIFEGYEKINNTAKMLSPLLFELQRGHLQQFSLTWGLLNKRMYQKYIFLEVQKIIPECILKLKQLVYSDRFKAVVYRFIQFDDEMTSTAQSWRDVWSLLHDYHKGAEDIARRKRISSGLSILRAVRDTDFIYKKNLNIQVDKPVFEWMSLDNREEIWHYVHVNLKTKWIACLNPRVTAPLENITCHKCKNSLATHNECSCRTCLIAGDLCSTNHVENTKQLYCTKCTFFEKLDRDYMDYKKKIVNKNSTSHEEKLYETFTDLSALAKISSGLKTNTKPKDIYHVSWALFKHLPDRVPYTLSVIEPDYFCIFQNNPCTNNACRVATNIIVLLYPLNFSKFLLHSYHPLNEEERKKLVTIHNFDFKNFIQKFCDDINQTTESNISSDKLHPLHFMDLLWESDDDSAVLSDMASAFAECYLIDFPPPQKHVLFTYILKLLRPNGKDIEIDMEWLEYVGNPKSLQCQSLILELPGKEGGKKRDERKIYEVQKKLEELNLKDEVLKKIENIAEISTLVNVEISALTDNDSDNESTTSISSSSTSSSPSKEELIETQIRKPLVEALKLAANNKKLEAELKSLQKEHSMLKDMVKDLEQIQDQNIHDKDHPETSTCKEHSFKNCHRQEGHGQCVCYYCTLFGQNGTECNSRIKETRERLRKRLHQIQSNKDTKSRNLKGAKISAELAKKIQSKQTARRSTTFEPKNYIPNRSTSPATTAKVNANPSTAKTKPASATPVQPPPPPPLQQQQQQQPATLKQEKPNVKPVIKAPLKIPLHSSNLKKNPIVQKNETIINTDQSTYSNKSLDDIIDYIEGSSSTGSAKKIAKKQKQKQKKSDKKKISSLEQLRQALDTLNERKKGIVKQLRILKSGKKKDITKINDIDNTLVMINSTASQLQNEMMKLVHSIRETNPDFDFPDINLTLDGISTNNDGNNKNTKVNNNGNINNNSNQQSRNEKIDSNDSNKNLDPNNSAFLKNMQKQFLPLFQKTVQSIAMQTKGGGSMGEAKRIVTIRRINTPHSEPQVTVTAKGLSPDKDQLLYTFINGQLVAATQENLKQQQQQQNMNQKPSVTLSKAKSANQNSAKSTANVNASTSCTQKTAAAASVPVSAATTAPTLSRRERKHLKKQQQLLQQQQKHMKTSDAQKATLSSSADSLVKENNKNETVSGNGKVIKTKEKNSNKENIVTNTNVKSSKRQQTPQPVEKCVEPPILVPAVSQKNAKVKNKKGKIVEPPPPPPVVPVAQVKEPKSNKKAANSVKEKPVPKPNAEELAKLNKKAEIKKVKNVQKRSAIDPEFDNNLFKLLNLEDSDSDDTEEDTSRLSESETPIVKCDLLKNNHINAIASTAAPIISNQPQINTTAKNKQNSKQKGKSVAAAPATNHPEKNTVQQQTQAQTQQQNKVLNTLKFEKVESKNKSKKKSIDNPLTKQEKKILLNADTTIEPIVKNKVLKQQQQQPVKQQSNPIISNHQQQLPQQTNVWNADQNYGVSIMEQLNRGIKVEGLSLPPGITLTRVDAEAAEKIRAQKESIRKLCQPMQTVVEPAKPQVIIANTPQMDNHYMANPMMQMGVAASPEGVIMVDTLKLNHSQNKPAVPEPSANVANQSKKSRRKNKNKKVDNIPTIEKINSLKEKSKNNAKNQNKNQTSINNNTCNNINNNQNSTPPNIVTLRNPMFHGLPDGIQYIHNKPPNSLPLNQPNRSNLGYDQPAAIIKNENGMFTIRNPALHQALASTSMNPEFSQSHNSPMKSESSGGYYNENIDVSGRTFNSAIGSELKNSAKQNAWNPDSNKSNLSQNTDIFSHLSHLNNQQTRCYSPFENNNNYGFNSDFLNAQSSHQPNNNSMPSNENYFSNLSNANGNNNGCYNVMNGFSAFGAGGNVNNCSAPDGACDANHMGSLFGSIGSNNLQNKGCDDINYNQGTPGGISKFDDLLFLQNLQPGQRLNSEVTIHNISESKFLRNQEQNISNDIEITTIPATGVSSMSSGFNKPHQMQQQQQQQQHHHHHQQQQQQQHHHHQQSHQHHRIINDRTSNKKTESGGEYGESVFAPNQTVNLNELEMEEREIESFKRFNYYFEPPKNKPKININVKDIVVNKKYKVTSDSPSSSLFGELSSSISSNTHSCDDLLSHDMSGLNLQSNTNSDPMIYDTDNENTARTDHGVIGSKIKYFVDK